MARWRSTSTTSRRAGSTRGAPRRASAARARSSARMVLIGSTGWVTGALCHRTQLKAGRISLPLAEPKRAKCRLRLAVAEGWARIEQRRQIRGSRRLRNVDAGRLYVAAVDAVSLQTRYHRLFVRIGVTL